MIKQQAVWEFLLTIIYSLIIIVDLYILIPIIHHDYKEWKEDKKEKKEKKRRRQIEDKFKNRKLTD